MNTNVLKKLTAIYNIHDYINSSIVIPYFCQNAMVNTVYYSKYMVNVFKDRDLWIENLCVHDTMNYPVFLWSLQLRILSLFHLVCN